MDRHSFLSSLDVLLPSASSEWPPRPLIQVVPHASASTAAASNAAAAAVPDWQQPRQDELHLDHQFLSIEAVIRQSGNDNSMPQHQQQQQVQLENEKHDKPKSEPDDKQLSVIFFDATSSSSSLGDPADPALCSAALYFYGMPAFHNYHPHTAQLNHKSSSSNHNTHHDLHHDLSHTPVSYRSFPSDHSRSPSHTGLHHTTGCHMACLTLRANDRVYYIDWTQLTRVQVLAATDDPDDGDASEVVAPTDPTKMNDDQSPLPPVSRRRRRPSCLLLHFPSCVFRIFSLQKHSQQQQQSTMELYRSFQERLQHWCWLRPTDNGGMMPTTLPILPGRRSLFESPVRLGSAGTTTESSSGEAAQTRMTLPQPALVAALATVDTADAPEDDDVVERNNGMHTAAAVGCKRSPPSASSSSLPPPPRHRRKIDGTDPAQVEGHAHALRQCQSHLTSLFTFLTMPVADTDTAGCSNVTDGSWAEALGTLLTTIADELAESYVPPANGDIQRQRNEEVLAETKHQYEQTLNAFFPAPQRGGTSSQKARRRQQQQQLRRQQLQDRQGSRRAPPITQQPRNLSSYKKEDAMPTSTSSVETTAKQMQELLQTYQAAVRRKHELLCLPSRGGPA